ncbi:4'-phosphopantetheinyl transferase superfamily protein [Streptomyces sp. NPDC048191]|uniref:4'-phosphopantetheinyl transferase family protein n=1 Tax=Streptomyces sp. NPDC048191 TaxID=3155484 RepID=UPI0033CB1ADF
MSHTVFPAIARGRVHRWGGATLLVVRCDTLGRRAPWSLPPLFTPAERHVFRGLPAWRQAEWGVGRLLAKSVVSWATGLPLAEVEILPRADGSPRVSVPGLHVSISHTTHHVAAVTAPGAVGVDLCETAAAPAVGRAAAHVLVPEERRLTGEVPELLTAAWALKEATVKADRRGLFGEAPRRVRILALTPPTLSGDRRTLVRSAGTATLAVVVGGDGRDG